MDFLLAALLVGLACSGYTAAVANSKDHDPASWGLGGLLFGPLALLASLGLPDLKARKYLRTLAEHHGAEAGADSSLTPAKDWEENADLP